MITGSNPVQATNYSKRITEKVIRFFVLRDIKTVSIFLTINYLNTFKMDPFLTALTKQLRQFEMQIIQAHSAELAVALNKSEQQVLEHGVEFTDLTSQVFIEHLDGSVFTLNNAFVLAQPDYYVVFTEHLGAHVLTKSELKTITVT